MAEKADGNPMGRSRADKGMRGRVLTKDGFSEGPGRGSLRLQVHAPAGGVLLGCWRPAGRENGMFGGRDIQAQGVGREEVLGIR